ncbi:unnamed protein product [Caenorhabditis brenneri]
MNKSDIILVFTAFVLAFSFRCLRKRVNSLLFQLIHRRRSSSPLTTSPSEMFSSGLSVVLLPPLEWPNFSHPSAEIVVAGNNEILGNLLVGLERHAIASTGEAKLRQAGSPMPKSYPVTLPTDPSAEIIVVGDNQTIGNILVVLVRRAIASTGMAKLRQAGPPMPKSNQHRHATLNKSDVILFFTALLLAFSFRCYKEKSEFSTLPTHPSAEIVVGNNQTIGSLLVGLERRAIVSTGMTKLRQAGPPMPKSYPVRTPPKKPTKKPTKKIYLSFIFYFFDLINHFAFISLSSNVG